VADFKSIQSDMPYITIALLLISFGFHPYAQSCVAKWFPSQNGRIIMLFLHPIIHTRAEHLLYNMIYGLGIVGVLVESWMTLLSRRVRYGILLICYLVSLGGSAFNWLTNPALGGHPAIGSSGIIFSALPFTILYYLWFSDRIEFTRLSRLAPLGIGFVSAFLIAPFVFGIVTLDDLMAGSDARLHLFVVFFSSIVAYPLLRRYAKQQPGEEHVGRRSH